VIEISYFASQAFPKKKLIGAPPSFMSKQKGLGGGFKHVFFTPTWGNDPFDKHIFSNGLPNHQLEDGDQSNGKLPLQTFRPFNRGEK